MPHDYLHPLLALISTVKEGHNLCTGAIIIRAEQTATDTACNAVFGCPRYSVGIIAISGNITE